MENLEGLRSLRKLFLGKNKIERLEGLETLDALQVLAVPGNRILRIEGLERATALEELYVGENGVERVEGLAALAHLRILDLAQNRIHTLAGAALAHLALLKELWVCILCYSASPPFRLSARCLSAANTCLILTIIANGFPRGRDDRLRRAHCSGHTF